MVSVEIVKEVKERDKLGRGRFSKWKGGRGRVEESAPKGEDQEIRNSEKAKNKNKQTQKSQ